MDMGLSSFLGAGLSAIGGIAGGAISAGGQAAANAANMAMNQSNINYQREANSANAAFVAGQNEANYYFQNKTNEENRDFQREINQRNIENVDRQIDFQKYMSNTAYQRAMADMYAGGLNPILAYQQGGASSPGGAASVSIAPKNMAPSGVAPHFEAPKNTFAMSNEKGELGRAISMAVSNAVETAKMMEGITQMQHQNELTKSTDQLTKEKLVTEGLTQRNIEQDTARKTEEVFKTNAETDYVKAQTGRTGADTTLTQQQIENMRRYGTPHAPNTIERVGRTIQSAVEGSGKNQPASAGNPTIRKAFEGTGSGWERIKDWYNERMKKPNPDWFK